MSFDEEHHHPSNLVPISHARRVRRPSGRGVKLPPPRRFVTAKGVFTQVINLSGVHDTVDDHPMPFEESVDVVPPSENEPDLVAEAVRSQRAAKEERQWRNWSRDIIPALLKPYMRLLRETDSLRHKNKVSSASGCSGCHLGRLIEVSCIYFDSKFLCNSILQ